MTDLNVDGSLHDEEVFYQLGWRETTWRGLAGNSGLINTCQFVLPEIFEQLRVEHIYGYRYLKPEHLQPPWTPELLLHINTVNRVLVHYKENSVPGNLGIFEEGSGVSNKLISKGESILIQAFEAFLAANLGTWVEWVSVRLRRFRRLSLLMKSQAKWVPFQIDLNSPSLFLDVTGPDVWQFIIYEITDQGRENLVELLRGMRMASIDYIMKEIPGPHKNPFRKFQPDLPFGYGVRTDIPSFGYRREHRSDTLFSGWAAVVMPHIDLFDEEVWDAKQRLFSR